jgi:hypothetical protein
MNFNRLKKSMQEKFAFMVKEGVMLFVTNADKHTLWEVFLSKFTPEYVQEHTCNSCRQFIKNYGNVVTIINGKKHCIWDVVDEDYQEIVDALKFLVEKEKIVNIFLTDSVKMGHDKSLETTSEGNKIVWDHFYLVAPTANVHKGRNSIDSVLGEYRTKVELFERSLQTITMDALDTVLELISQNSIYRGAEFKPIVSEFKQLKLNSEGLDLNIFCWSNSKVNGAVTGIRNTSIGTLLINLSEGMDLDGAVRAFENIVAPHNYKRPTALVTKKMIDQAKETIKELGYEESLGRRLATINDLNINDVLFIDRNKPSSLDVFEEMKEEVKVDSKNFSKVESIHIDKFLEEVLPSVKSIEVLFDNNHLNNLVTIVTAKDIQAKSMFKWNNPFSWHYCNGVTDSIKENVKKAGGKIDALLRFSLQWNEDGKDICDLDLHVKYGNKHIYFAYRHTEEGFLDVDMINPSKIGVENIVFNSVKKNTNYSLIVDNYNDRKCNAFSVEIEYKGKIFNIHRTGSFKKRHVNVANVTFTGSDIEVNTCAGFSLESSSKSVKKWDICTKSFYPVSAIFKSPNHWNESIGNMHTFFIVDSAKIPEDETIRGFFNEFLTADLDKNRKVLEILASKLAVENTGRQLSGLGFSSTINNSLICKVKGKFERVLNITF